MIILLEVVGVNQLVSKGGKKLITEMLNINENVGIEKMVNYKQLIISNIFYLKEKSPSKCIGFFDTGDLISKKEQKYTSFSI